MTCIIIQILIWWITIIRTWIFKCSYSLQYKFHKRSEYKIVFTKYSLYHYKLVFIAIFYNNCENVIFRSKF